MIYMMTMRTEERRRVFISLYNVTWVILPLSVVLTRNTQTKEGNKAIY